MGKGGGPPWKCCKVLFVLQMLSKVSVDEVFNMHYFVKMLSASGALPPDPNRVLPLDLTGGLSSFKLPHCSPLKKILRAPIPQVHTIRAGCMEATRMFTNNNQLLLKFHETYQWCSRGGMWGNAVPQIFLGGNAIRTSGNGGNGNANHQVGLRRNAKSIVS